MTMEGTIERWVGVVLASVVIFGSAIASVAEESSQIALGRDIAAGKFSARELEVMRVTQEKFRKRFEKIYLKEVDFDDIPFTEACEELVRLSRIGDSDGNGIAKISFANPEWSKSLSKFKVKLAVQNVRLEEALTLMTRASGFRFYLKDDGVVIQHEFANRRDLFLEKFAVAPDFRERILERTGGKTSSKEPSMPDLIGSLAGVPFISGATAILFEARGELWVFNNSSYLRAVRQGLASLDDPEQRVAQDDEAKKMEAIAAIERKLREIILPEFKVSDQDLMTTLWKLETKSKERDIDDEGVSFGGVSVFDEYIYR